MTQSLNESLLPAVPLPWYAVHIQPRREDLAEANLQAFCGGVFCPGYRQRVILHGYKREVVRPLFPSYLFAAFDAPRDFRAVHYAHGVRGGVSFGGVLATAPANLLAIIGAHMQDGYVVLAAPQLQHGQRVEIVAGSFRGYTGLFQSGLKGSDRV